MHITARIDYALRAMLALAAAEPASLTAQAIAKAEQMPLGYLYQILVELRNAEFVIPKRGKNPGYTLARPSHQITLGEIIRVMEGPLNGGRASQPAMSSYEGAGTHLPGIWFAANAAMLAFLDQITLAGILADRGGDANTSPAR